MQLRVVTRTVKVVCGTVVLYKVVGSTPLWQHLHEYANLEDVQFSFWMQQNLVQCAGNTQRTGVAVDVERKVALLLEHGIRADRQAAERLVSAHGLRHYELSDYQQRIELLLMYGCPLEAMDCMVFRSGLKTKALPLLAFLDKHGCALRHCTGDCGMPERLQQSCQLLT